MAKLRQPARTLGLVFGNKTYVYPEAALDLGRYDPLSDPYYADTAYTGMQSPNKVFANLNSDQDYPRKHLPRLDYYPQIKGDDYIANTDALNIYQTKPRSTNKTGILPVPKSLEQHDRLAFQIEYLAPKYNVSNNFFTLACWGVVICKVLPLLGLLLVMFLAIFMGFYSTWYSFFRDLLYLGLMSLFGLLIWKSAIKMAEKFPDTKYSKLNRRTGMVCFPQRGKKPDIEIPFAEFEPRFFQNSSPSGFYHGLIYIHKSGKRRFTAGHRCVGDVYTYAAYLEQFMDIT